MPPRRSGVSGHDAVARRLKALAKGPTSGEVDRAAISSMKPMLEKTKERAKTHRDFIGKWPGFPEPASPPPGGHVDEGLVVKRVREGQGYVYRLGAVKRARYLLHLLEFGTSPHWQSSFRGGWMHPGAQANPVLIPSYDEEKAAVPRAIGEKLWAAMKARALAR